VPWPTHLRAQFAPHTLVGNIGMSASKWPNGGVDFFKIFMSRAQQLVPLKL